jgi:hypothetical protein
MKFDFDYDMDYEVPKEENYDFSFGENPMYDPFIKEFLAFCKLNGLEEKAVELLDKKIKEKKRARH